MSGKKYLIILTLLLLAMICTVGAATWVIASPAYFDAAVTDNITDSTYINLTYYIAEEDSINDDLRAVFGESPIGIQLLELDDYEIWMPDGVTHDSIRNNKSYSHAFLGWFVGSIEIKSFDDIIKLYQKSAEVNFTLTAHWQAKANITIIGKYAETGNSGYYMPQDVVTVCSIDSTILSENNEDISKQNYFAGWTVTGGEGEVVYSNSYTYTVPSNVFGSKITITENTVQKVTLTVTLQAISTALPLKTASATVIIDGFKIMDSLTAKFGEYNEKVMKPIYLMPGQHFKIEAPGCRIIYNGKSIANGSIIEVQEGQSDIDLLVSNP